MLNNSVEGDGKAGDERDGNCALNIGARFDLARGKKKDDEVGRECIKPLQALVRTKKRNGGRNRECGADNIRAKQKERGNCQWIFSRSMLNPRAHALSKRHFGAASGASPAPTFRAQDEPKRAHGESERPNERNFVGLKDAVGINVEKEGGDDEREEPAGLNEFFGKKRESG